jgi:23S rRNA-intervening sequence protein
MEKPHKKLEVWKQSMDFVAEIYKSTEGLPSDLKSSYS